VGRQGERVPPLRDRERRRHTDDGATGVVVVVGVRGRVV
jgi:hypothetical protein